MNADEVGKLQFAADKLQAAALLLSERLRVASKGVSGRPLRVTPFPRAVIKDVSAELLRLQKEIEGMGL